MKGEPSVYERLVAIVGETAADEVIELLEEELATPCRDADCLRRGPHARLGLHRWRHIAQAPLTQGLLGWRCFTCGKPTWHPVHRIKGDG